MLYVGEEGREWNGTDVDCCRRRRVCATIKHFTEMVVNIFIYH